MVRSIIEGVAAFFADCALLKDGAFRVDALSDSPIEYAIEVGIFDPIVEQYIDGSSDRRYQFNFGSRESYSMDRLQNIANHQRRLNHEFDIQNRQRLPAGAAG